MIEAVQAQDYDGFTDWLITRDNPYAGKNVYGNVQLAYEKMRRVALAEGYSAVWVVEADTIPPPDALTKLLTTMDQTNADVVTGLYVLRHGEGIPNLFEAWRGPDIGHGMGWQEVSRVWGQTIPVAGGCMGCVLAKTAAIADFNFELGAPPDGRNLRAPDIEWMRHNWQAGRVTLARLDVMCGHKNAGRNILRPEDYRVK